MKIYISVVLTITGILFGTLDSTYGEVLSLRPDVIEGEVLVFGERSGARSGELRLDRLGEDFGELTVVMGRERFRAEDGHLEVLVFTALEDGRWVGGRVLGEGGDELAEFDAIRLPGARFCIFPALPVGLAEGGIGALELWILGEDGGELARWSGSFVVEEPQPRESGAAVEIRIDNPDGVYAEGIPFTVGVPFARGDLRDLGGLRLLRHKDGALEEVPIQASEASRWTKYGSYKWVHVDFVLSLSGEPVVLTLEYGPGVAGHRRDPIAVGSGDGFQRIDLGRLELDGGVSVEGLGPVLENGALAGAFVEREGGVVYRMARDGVYRVEQDGPEKVVLRSDGYFVAEENGDKFCRYLVRYILHRDSNLIRVVYTWFFTGGDEGDRIASMGWRFHAAQPFEAGGFLERWGDSPQWLDGSALVQYDYEHFDILRNGERYAFDGRRSPGVAAAVAGGQPFYLGIRDFWQNYPSEMELADDGLIGFYNWPRNNRGVGHTFAKKWQTDIGDPVQTASAARYALESQEELTRSEWTLNILQHRFAHEGEVLDFSVPPELSNPPLNWRFVDTISAQGTSRTEEFWLYFPSNETSVADAVAVLKGLNDDSLRATVDPVWVAASGAFNEVHPRDVERFPEEERAYELAALSWSTLAERLGMYGMWIYGDLPAWEPHPDAMIPSIRRSFQKQHLGWPYSWLPYARSGDSRLLNTARANTRRIIDTGYSHYVSEENPDGRRLGYLGIGPLVWRNSDGIHIWGTHNSVDYLIDAWHIDACYRARDMVEFLSHVYRDDPPQTFRFGRITNGQLKYCIDHFNMTGDPWFLAAAHAIAEGHMQGWSPEFPVWQSIEGDGGHYGGRAWNTGDQEFIRLTGDTRFTEDFYLRRHVPRLVTEWLPTHYNRRHPQYADKAFAYWLTGDEYYRRRAANAAASSTALVGDGEAIADYLQGFIHSRGQSTGYTIFTGYHLRWLPLALAVLADQPTSPAPIVTTFMTTPPPVWRSDDDDYRTRMEIAILKESEGEEIPLRLMAWGGASTPTALRSSVVAEYRLVNQAGRSVLEGLWDYGEKVSERAPQYHEITLPASLPTGVYRLKLGFPAGGQVGLAMPISPWDVKEVVEWQPNRESFDSTEGSFWFKVAPGHDSFQISFREQGMTLAMVWDPDGRRVWNQGDFPPDGVDSVGRARHTVEIPVARDQVGKLWRVTSPGRFSFSDAVIPILATSPEKWFDLDPEISP